MEVRGLEPLASSMRPRRSSQLSYTPAASEFTGATPHTEPPRLDMDHLPTRQPLATRLRGMAMASLCAGRSG